MYARCAVASTTKKRGRKGERRGRESRKITTRNEKRDDTDNGKGGGEKQKAKGKAREINARGRRSGVVKGKKKEKKKRKGGKKDEMRITL